MVDESQFTERALAFIAEFTADPNRVTADTPLDGVEELDSLFVVAFLQFLEDERGAPLPIADDGGIPVEALGCVRTAYELVTSPE